MDHVPFPNRVKRLENGVLEKPYSAKKISTLNELIKRQESRGWKIKREPYQHNGFWFVIMIFKRVG